MILASTAALAGSTEAEQFHTSLGPLAAHRTDINVIG